MEEPAIWDLVGHFWAVGFGLGAALHVLGSVTIGLLSWLKGIK